MTDKKPDIDEFNFDDKTEKKNVLDPSMMSSRADNQINPAALAITAVFFGVLIYYFWPSSPQHSAEKMMKQEIEKRPPAVVVQAEKKVQPAEPKVESSPQPAVVPESELQIPSAHVEAKQIPSPVIAAAPKMEMHPQLKIDDLLKDLYEKQAVLAEQISQQSAANQAALQKNHQELKALINQLIINNQDVQKKQSQIEKTVDALNKKIADSHEAMKNIEQVMRVQLQEFQVSQHDLVSPMPAPEYSLHAVIPGRAWLRQNNHIFSVVEGQDLEPYGKIMSIDARQGIVITSSGQILRYS